MNPQVNLYCQKASVELPSYNSSAKPVLDVKMILDASLRSPLVWLDSYKINSTLRLVPNLLIPVHAGPLWSQWLIHRLSLKMLKTTADHRRKSKFISIVVSIFSVTENTLSTAIKTCFQRTPYTSFTSCTGLRLPQQFLHFNEFLLAPCIITSPWLDFYASPAQSIHIFTSLRNNNAQTQQFGWWIPFHRPVITHKQNLDAAESQGAPRATSCWITCTALCLDTVSRVWLPFLSNSYLFFSIINILYTLPLLYFIAHYGKKFTDLHFASLLDSFPYACTEGKRNLLYLNILCAGISWAFLNLASFKATFLKRWENRKPIHKLKTLLSCPYNHVSYQQRPYTVF